MEGQRQTKRQIHYRECMALIVGSGAAGFAAANRLQDLGVKDILMATEGKNMGTSRNTGSDKQTYYKLNLCGSISDSVQNMAKTLFDGESMDGDLALCEAANSMRCFYYLVEAGVPFPDNEMGEFAGYKTDHDPVMRATSAGPLTSKYMTEALEEAALRKGLRILDHLLVTDVIRDEENVCRGVLGLDLESGDHMLIQADYVIFATGGPAGIYKACVYPESQKGSSGVLLRAGAKAKNLMEWQYGLTSIQFRWNVSGSYQQVLPAYISTNQDGSDPREFLNDGFEDEAAKLEAQFLKGYQWPFDPRKVKDQGSSLIDVLVYREITEKGRRVFLDYRRNPSGLITKGEDAFQTLAPVAREYLENSGCLLETPILRLQKMNPKAIDLYASHGIDLTREMLEIAVCAQHNNGGISGDCHWESDIPGLFAVGEVNGSHGIYRPGGAALNSGQVGALRASQRIAQYLREKKPLDRPGKLQEAFYRLAEDAMQENEHLISIAQHEQLPADQMEETLTALMSRNCAHMRSREKTAEAIRELDKMRQSLAMAISDDKGSENDVCSENRKDGKDTDHVDLMKRIGQIMRLRDLLSVSAALAESIRLYEDMGGGSRGSYLMEDAPLDLGAHKDQIVEVWFDKEGQIRSHSRSVRPIPQRELWFENVWNAYNQSHGLV